MNIERPTSNVEWEKVKKQLALMGLNPEPNSHEPRVAIFKPPVSNLRL
jgi:hypothetical protein